MSAIKGKRIDNIEVGSTSESRLEANRTHSRNHRTKMLELGKIQLKTFIEPSTREGLLSARSDLALPDKATLGEIIDALWKNFSENSKKC